MCPKVSVIVPVYNPGELLDRCIESILSQSLREIEMILVDDCSSDGSREKMQRCAVSDGRVILIDSETHGGAGKARNRGLEAARGEMLAFVDSDDFIDAGFLEKLWDRHVETGADIVKGERLRYSVANGTCSPDSPFCVAMHGKVKTGKGFFTGAFTSAIYARSLYSDHGVRFLEDVTFFEDAYFPIAAELFNVLTETVDGAFYYYTFNPSSVCNTVSSAKQESDRLKGGLAVMDLIDTVTGISDEHYLRLYDFLFSGVYSICRNNTFSNDGLRAAVQGLLAVIARCKKPEALLCRHFDTMKTQDRRALIDAVRRK